MSLADEMRTVTNVAVNTDVVMQRYWDKTMEVIRGAAMKGNSYVCFYDCCHPCDKDYSKDAEQKLITKLRQNGFKVTEKWRIFGGNQITPYIVW